MIKYFITVNSETNEINGRFTTLFERAIPISAIEITQSQYNESLDSTHFIDDEFSYISPPLSDEQVTRNLKLQGVEIQGKMISLTKANQDGFSFIDNAILKAEKKAMINDYLPVYPILETANGEVTLTVNSVEEWDDMFIKWTLARNDFFTSTE